jgi:hypothetical protein
MTKCKREFERNQSSPSAGVDRDFITTTRRMIFPENFFAGLFFASASIHVCEIRKSNSIQQRSAISSRRGGVFRLLDLKNVHLPCKLFFFSFFPSIFSTLIKISPKAKNTSK